MLQRMRRFYSALSIHYSIASTTTRAMTTTTTSPTTKALPIAAIAQLRSTSNKLENLINVSKCARMANEQGASILFLPECFGFMSGSTAQTSTLMNAEQPIEVDQSQNSDEVTTILSKTVQNAFEKEDVKDFTNGEDTSQIALLDGLRTIACESKLWISAGGMHCRGAPPNEAGEERVYNTHIIMDDSGDLKAVYRKIHLFDVTIPGKVNLQESKTTAPGTKLVVCDSPIGKLGLSTCYDMRFPEMYEQMVRAGAQVLLAPSAFTVPTGKAHWHTLLKARAIENQCYMLASAQYGTHNEKRKSYGHAVAIGPWGEVLADAGGYGFDPNEDHTETLETPSIVTCEIDLDLVDSVRQRMPLRMHRDNAQFSF